MFPCKESPFIKSAIFWVPSEWTLVYFNMSVAKGPWKTPKSWKSQNRSSVKMRLNIKLTYLHFLSFQVILKWVDCGGHPEIRRSSCNMKVILDWGGHPGMRRSPCKFGDHAGMWRSSWNVEVILECEGHPSMWRSSWNMEISLECGGHNSFI